jgi:hypothetical protein
MKNLINESSEFRFGNEIYNPKTNQYNKIFTAYYMDVFGEILVFIESSNKNLEENVISYRLSHLIRLGYYIITI